MKSRKIKRVAAGLAASASVNSPTSRPSRRSDPTTTIVLRTEKRSWITLAITGFGALLLRYLKTVRERGHTVRHK